MIDEFKNRLGQAGKKGSLYEYDADHALANTNNLVYDNRLLLTLMIKC